MSVNLEIQNWPAASSPTPSAPTQMMYRSTIELPKLDKANVFSNCGDDELWNRSCLKLVKTEENKQGSAIANKKSSQPVFSSEEHQMLSFSASEKVQHFPDYFYNNSASHYNPNITGYYSCGGAANMHDMFNGPFTPSQWLELEHQALIYKHIISNMPVPPSLLMPIRKALSQAAFSGYNAGHFTSMGWGGFHMGLQNNNDPEPGRCRRTDGKKWRCSRDAVADQKYCERHINRGRHRSRKPVEGQTRYSVGNASSANFKPIPTSLALISDKRKVSLDKKNSLIGTSGTFESAHNSRISMNKDMASNGNIQVDSYDLLVPPSKLQLNPRESLYNVHNNKQGSCAQPFGSDFGLVSYDALKNPNIRTDSTPTRQFMDDCPKNQPEAESTMWPHLDDAQLSIAPMTHHVTDSPSLTLAWEFDPTPMGLELGSSKNTDQQLENEEKHTNWIPIIHDSIIGGPLGEALQNGQGTNNAEIKHSSSKLNLTIDGWKNGPRFISSPTGVLHKEAAFASRTNSSAGSSPRAETNMAATF